MNQLPLPNLPNPFSVDVPFVGEVSVVPSSAYDNNAVVSYKNILNSYIPRTIAQITKYNLIQWALAYIGINQKWLVMLLVIIL